ncbi:opacity protein-like surface antigen [Neisseria perflava]|uniref:porin family protein n=1 Tax=Neisseria perflava TaxID=33053 RepID=UPI00209F1620|nr:porin family protein [Neisseria perflava]MCP1772334.1 opacity protein-like surface antigen [Neisseria perflava]
MKNTKLLTALAAMGASFVAFDAQAGSVTDSHGNVGYDTAAECDAAVQSGRAKFYQSFTHKPALKRAGEASVRVATIKDLGPEYRLGACDMGVGHKEGRDGVASALHGKYIPFHPDMPINVYSDASGKPVRVTMKQCDNWFSDNAPRPVALPVERKAAPVAAAAPVVAAPVVAAKSGLRPYVFGTLGVLNDRIEADWVDDNDTKFAGQVGAGLQFNEWLGAELFYQGSAKHKFEADNGDIFKSRNNTYGGRVTLGTEVLPQTRVFLKAGVVGIQHKIDGYDKTKVHATAGLGATYDLTDHWALRADYDHYFKRKGENSIEWKGADYFGIGAQYKF